MHGAKVKTVNGIRL